MVDESEMPDGVRPGEWIDIDEYVLELEEAGVDVDYENMWSGTSGFTAQITIDGKDHAVVEGDTLGHIVKDVQNRLHNLV